MPRRSRRLFDLLASQAGNALIITGLTMPILIGAAGLATDTVQWSLWKRELQRQADSAALAGAYAKAQGASAGSAALTDINRHKFVTLYGTPLIENAPTVGPYAGNNAAVRVKLSTRQRLPFSAILTGRTPTLSAEGTAAVISNGHYCVIALEKTTAVGITMQGNASVSMGCGMSTNSQGSPAVSAGGSSSIYATPIMAVGGIPNSNNYAAGTQLMPYSLPQPDPFQSLPDPNLNDPAMPSCSGKLSVSPNNTKNVNNPSGAACYRGMDLKGTVNFAPGIYYIDGSSISIGSQAVVTGTGVTFILTSSTASTNPSTIATLDINGGAKLTLSPPTTGVYAGILFYQDRRALDSGTDTINGNAASSLTGAIYFPSQAIQFSGDSGMNTNCIQIVTKRVTFIGNNNISNVCPPPPPGGTGPHDFTGVVVRLVG